ncbi:MAG: ribose-phosphate pyrophosphokinase-like domain-containing protein [Candidatus Omnitrophica bacterium]|nr:ribose-phosphate pyrophosphokinase-like domain-containing protein [Candidatus Omnitrophota bacterium]
MLKKFIILLIFIPLLSQNSFLKRDFSYRRILAPRASFYLATSDGRPISLEYGQFPDKELYLRFLNPQEIKEAAINFAARIGSADDFLKILLTLGALRQYQAREITLILEDWTPFSEEDYLLISIFRIFADKVCLAYTQTKETYFLPIKPITLQEKVTGPIHIDYVTYLTPRFKPTVEEAVSRLQDAESAFIKVSQDFSGHWEVSLPFNLVGKNVVIIHSTENSENILSLILTSALMRLKGVKTVSLINTYQGYSRQDKEFKEGECISSYILLKVLNSLLDHNFTVNVHYGKKSGLIDLSPEVWITDDEANRQTLNVLTPQAVYNLNGFVQLAEGLLGIIKKEQGITDLRSLPLLLISPDDGSFFYVKEAVSVLRDRYGIEAISGYLNKERLGSSEVVITGEILENDGRPLTFPYSLKDYYIFILDDETSTGSTIKSAVYHLVEKLGIDYNKIYAGVVHGKFSLGTEEFYKLKDKEMLPQVLVTLDTLEVPEGIKTISSSALIAYCIKRILGLTEPIRSP